MEKSMQIVMVVIVILATALIIMVIFNKGMGDWMSIFGDWGGRAADEATCRQACIRYCSGQDQSASTGWDDLGVDANELKTKKSCSQLMATGSQCKCGFGVTP